MPAGRDDQWRSGSKSTDTTSSLLSKGHGVYNAGALLRSRIILAAGSLFLKDAAGMDLGDVEYLEALGCETMLGAWNNRVSAMASFAGPFLSAGVGGVVGSIWCQIDSYIWAIHVKWIHEELARCTGPLTQACAVACHRSAEDGEQPGARGFGPGPDQEPRRARAGC